MTFAEVEIGALFRSGSNVWRKSSTRTATMVEEDGEKLSFYWGKREPVTPWNGKWPWEA